jgi:hypothetical protein
MTHTLPRHAAPGPVRTTGGWAPPRHRARVRTTVPAMTRALALGAIVGALTMTPAIADAGWTPARVADLTQLPACANGEAPDTIGARCVWDASHMGNGQGRSFRINRAGVVKYLSHDRAHDLTLGVTRDGRA